jgi:catechol 2,3-dioxygenase-like lactoylglutathione lyase family enzyme
MQSQLIIPVLRILDVPKAKEFYVDWLGFNIDWQHRFGDNFPLYMQVSREDITLHLTEHYGDCIPGARIRIRVEDLSRFHQQLGDYKYYKPGVSKTEWDTLEMPLLDPFGSHLVFVQELKK